MVIVIKRLTFSPSFSFLAHISHTVLYSFPKVQTGGICMFNNIPRASFLVMIPFTLVTLMFDLGLTL